MYWFSSSRESVGYAQSITNEDRVLAKKGQSTVPPSALMVLPACWSLQAGLGCAHHPQTGLVCARFSRSGVRFSRPFHEGWLYGDQ